MQTGQSANANTPRRPKVIIVGGGFGGLYAAKELANQPVDVLLIDKKNHHTFQPLLYQVALAVLTPSEIASPLRRIVRKADNVETLLAEVIGFDTAGRRVKLSGGTGLPYDYLIVAAGARHSYFGHDEWEHHAPGLKTIEDAVEIRRRLLSAFEEAERKAILTGHDEPLTFVIVGGGPTGVELAGAIADLSRRALAKDFKAIDTTKTRVRLYEGSPRVLGTFAEESSREAQRQLEELGVEVLTNKLVTGVETGRIKVGEEWLPVSVTLWATGVAASPLGRQLGVETDRAGRVPIEADLSLAGHREVFVIGDMSSLTDVSGTKVPGLGAAAMQQGQLTAANILRDMRGEKRKLFRYHNRGTMATIGHNRAVAELAGRRFSGWIAWVLWLGVHILLLIGFRNRVAVLSSWIWAYFKREGPSSLITEHSERADEIREPSR